MYGAAQVRQTSVIVLAGWVNVLLRSVVESSVVVLASYGSSGLGEFAGSDFSCVI